MGRQGKQRERSGVKQAFGIGGKRGERTGESISVKERREVMWGKK